MARAPRPGILTGVFCLAELSGIEPLTPCLQTRPGPPADHAEC
jgi:hypothetical protein